MLVARDFRAQDLGEGEKDKQISRTKCCRGSCYDVHDHRDDGRQRNMQESLAGLVRVPCVGDAGDDCDDIRGCGEEQSRHAIVSKASNDTEEIQWIH